MNKFELAGYILIKAIFDQDIGGYADQLSPGKRLKRAKQGAENRLLRDIQAMTLVSAEELCRANGYCSYLEEADHRYIVCLTQNTDMAEKVMPVDEFKFHPMTVFKNSRGAVMASSDIEKLNGILKESNVSELVIVDTHMRIKHAQKMLAHTHLIPRLTPSFNYFSQSNSPQSSLAAAKVVVASEIVETLEFVRSINLKKYDSIDISELINKVESKLALSRKIHTHKIGKF